MNEFNLQDRKFNVDISAVQQDHMCDRITFVFPKNLNEEDITGEDYKIWVKWINKNFQGNSDECEKVIDTENVKATWVLTNTVTQVYGPIYFSVEIIKSHLEDEKIIVDFSWNSEIETIEIKNTLETLDDVKGGNKDYIHQQIQEYIKQEGEPFKGPKGDKGERGADGQDGKSAYEIAIKNGYVGTEQDWLASLKGEPGKLADNSVTTAKIVDRAITREKIAEGVLPLMENLKEIFVINSDNDYENFVSRYFDEEENILLKDDEYVLLFITENLENMGLEKGIIYVSNILIIYLNKTLEDLNAYATIAFVRESLNKLKYKKVYEKTLTQEVGLINIGALKLKEALIVIKGIRSSSNTNITAKTIFTLGTNEQSVTHSATIASNYSVFSATADNINYLKVSALGTYVQCQASYRRDTTSIGRPLNGCENILNGEYLTNIIIQPDVTGAVLGIGTKIEIWGIED